MFVQVQFIDAWHQNGKLGWIYLFSNVKYRFIGMVARTGGQFLMVVGVAHLVFIEHFEACLCCFQ